MQPVHHEKTPVKLRLVSPQEKPDENSPTIMLIRHGDRNKIPEGEFGNDVELNPLGWTRSTQLGQSLSANRINGIFVSPITRCVQTGQAIATGLGKNITPEPSHLLGDPGAFVYDGELAGKTYMQLGFRKFYNHLLEGIPLEGNHPIRKGAEILTGYLVQKSQQPGLHIFVSHDMIVALYAFALFGMKFIPDVNWIGYLEGVTFQIITP